MSIRSLTTARSAASTDLSRVVSMDIDPDTAAKNTRKYPSIRDYYQSSCNDTTKPIQLQHGLSNYSSLVLGDDRISFTESLCSASYRVAIEEKLVVDSPSKSKTLHSRRREYQEAQDKVDDIEVNRLEKVMKDKLIQRNRMSSSPFHVRKAFKFFDRDQQMRIHIEGFTRALEFLGFQFSEVQNLALFARYDTNFTGEIDYMNFIETAMFYSSHDSGEPQKTLKQKREVEDLYQVPDVDDSELLLLQEAELKRIFNKIDSNRSGSINKDQFELLLLAIGYNATQANIDNYFADMGLSNSSLLPFELFFEWWTSDVGHQLLPRLKTNTGK